jgi:hypothetical protein
LGTGGERKIGEFAQGLERKAEKFFDDSCDILQDYDIQAQVRMHMYQELLEDNYKIFMEKVRPECREIIDKFLDVENYVVCSVGRMRVGENEEKMVSLGVFGHVFTFGKEDIEKAWTKAMDDYEANHKMTPPPAPAPQNDETDDYQDEEAMPDPGIIPDSVMGVEIPEGMDSMVNQMANEAMRMAKEWAKQQIDRLGK